MKIETIKNLQATMKLHHFYNGDVDGNWGNMSQAGFYAMAEAAATNAIAREEHCLNKTPVLTKTPEGKFTLSKKSLDKLADVHKDLRKVVKRAIELSEVDFLVGEGLRSIARQKALFASGDTKTMNSRHLTGHAVDLYAIDSKGKITWDWDYYHKINAAMVAAAKELNTPLEWGGNWSSFKDGPHYQLPWDRYGR